MIEGTLGRVRLGDGHRVKMMAVINRSAESFYKASVAPLDRILEIATSMVEEGADIIDIGAVSTAPGSNPISESLEKERLFPALSIISDNLDVEISVDTQRGSIAEQALLQGAGCINDVSCLNDPSMAKTVADANGSLILMASASRPGDLLEMKDIIPRLGLAVARAVDAGVQPDKISVDPGIGRFVPEKTPDCDLGILDGLRRLRVLNKPILAAVSRKSFIGSVLALASPDDRLMGSISAATIAVYNGAHIVRTHDIRETLDAVRMAEAIRGRPASGSGRAGAWGDPAAPAGLQRDITAEVLSWSGFAKDCREIIKEVQAGSGAEQYLCRKSSFRAIVVEGITSMEALIIKQEMLARGGDAAIPGSALLCSPGTFKAVIYGTEAQIEGVCSKLRRQPFGLPAAADAVSEALMRLQDRSRYRT